jgi:hypothetical protein
VVWSKAGGVLSSVILGSDVQLLKRAWQAQAETRGRSPVSAMPQLRAMLAIVLVITVKPMTTKAIERINSTMVVPCLSRHLSAA